MAKRMCIECKEREATVPDRNQPGRPIKRVCAACHAKRLRGDLAEIKRLASHRGEREQQ